MKIFRYGFLAVSAMLLVSAMAFGQGKPATEERLIRVEEGVKNLEKRIDGLETSMNKRIDGLETSMNKRIDDLRADMNIRLDDIKNFMLWGFGVLFSGMFILIGFILWDRRTTLAPVAKETKELRELIELLQKDDKTVKTILREYAKENEALAKILNKAALL